MHACTERLHRRVAFARDVEAVRVVENSRVAVGRSGPGEDQCACLDGDASELDVVRLVTEGLANKAVAT